MSPQEIIPLLMRHVEAENAHDMERTLATLHPDCVFEDVAAGKVYRGHAGAAEYYRSWWDAFGLQFRRGDDGARHLTTEGAVVAEGHFHGRHVGTFNGIEATGRAVDFRFAVVVSFRDGLMAGERFYYDRRSLEQQLAGPSA